jgi:hypothetical protein
MDESLVPSRRRLVFLIAVTLLGAVSQAYLIFTDTPSATPVLLFVVFSAVTVFLLYRLFEQTTPA